MLCMSRCELQFPFKFLFISYNLSCYYHWVDTTAGGLLVPEGIIRPVVSTSVLT